MKSEKPIKHSHNYSINLQLNFLYIIISNFSMITPQNNQMMYQNRKSQKPTLTAQELTAKIDKETYERTIASLLDYCHQLGILQSTTFLARAYLDIIIKKLAEVKHSELSLMCICCVWIAIKFNQSSETSSNFHAQIMHQHGNQSFTKDQLIRAESMFYCLLSYKLAYTTPYHYIEPFFQGFPWFTSIKKVMPDMIDFSNTIPELICASSQDIFFGVFSACLKIKKCTLTTFQQSVLNAQIVNIQAVDKIKQIMEKYYNIAIYGDDNMDEQTQNEDSYSSCK